MRRYHENKDKLTNERNFFYEKTRVVLLAKSKIFQQNRKTHTQQIKDLNNKREKLTRAMETLILKIE